jgi:5-methylcytosine-specific restriction protein A
VRRPACYCAAHAGEERRERADRNRYYDQHRRDADAKAFYNSQAWANARATKLAHDPVCERCRRRLATTVHHRIPLDSCTPEQRLQMSNLMSLCGPECHNAEEAETRRCNT